MELLENTTSLEKVLMLQAHQARVPINGSIELLPLCNMNCDMCYVRLSREEMEKQGRLRTTAEWIEIAKQMQKAGVLFLLLTGGEPFLYPEFCELYIKLQEMGFILTINTNGTLIDEKLAKFLGEHPPRRVNITLYGASEEVYTNLCHYPGGFEKTINAVKLLQKYNVDMRLGVSVAKSNQEEVDKIIDLGDALGVPVYVDTYMLPATRERDVPYNLQARMEPQKAAQIKIHALKRKMGDEGFAQYVVQTMDKINNPQSSTSEMSCLAGKCSFTINWQGEIRPCVISSNPAISVFDVGFEAAWEYIVAETGKILLGKTCAGCRMRPLCHTCAAAALLEAGSYDAVPNYLCQYAEEMLTLLKHEMSETRNS